MPADDKFNPIMDDEIAKQTNLSAMHRQQIRVDKGYEGIDWAKLYAGIPSAPPPREEDAANVADLIAGKYAE